MNSKDWYQRHRRDLYVKKANASHYRSRAAFKLQQIDEKERLIKPGMVIVDLGAAPGGWSQVASEKVGAKGKVFALDRLPVQALADVTVIQGDFTETETLDALTNALKENDIQHVGGVVSDMAPDLTGIKLKDEAAHEYLVDLALDFSRQFLGKNGFLLAKVFQGATFETLRKSFMAHFKKVKIIKPDASRKDSKEVYLLGISKK